MLPTESMSKMPLPAQTSSRFLWSQSDTDKFKNFECLLASHQCSPYGQHCDTLFVVSFAIVLTYNTPRVAKLRSLPWTSRLLWREFSLHTLESPFGGWSNPFTPKSCIFTPNIFLSSSSLPAGTTPFWSHSDLPPVLLRQSVLFFRLFVLEHGLCLLFLSLQTQRQVSMRRPPIMCHLQNQTKCTLLTPKSMQLCVD